MKECCQLKIIGIDRSNILDNIIRIFGGGETSLLWPLKNMNFLLFFVLLLSHPQHSYLKYIVHNCICSKIVFDILLNLCHII
jgi:hypothetical protein